MCQTYDISGKWVGTIKNKFKDTTYVAPFVLDIRLIDTCNHIYRVEQFEKGPNSGHIAYNFIQTGNTLLRDGMSYYKNYNADGNGLAHLKLKFNEKIHTLIGIRSDRDNNNYDDNIYLSLKKDFKPISCTEVKLSLICNSFIKPVFIDTITVDLDEIIHFTVTDNNVQDNDLVSVFIGKSQILNNAPLYSDSYTIPIKITKDTLVTWCACNQGKVGLNTGLFGVNIKGVEKKMEVYIKTNERVSFFIRIKQYESKIVVRDWENVNK